MFKWLAVGGFALAVVFNVWGGIDATWNWVLLMLIGLLCMALSNATGK